MIKQNSTSPKEITLEDRRVQAAGQYDATYARNVDMADKYIAIWTKIFPTVWVESKDRAGYIDAVVKAKGGTVYVSVHMRKNKASDPYAHGTANDVSDPQSFWVDFDVATDASGKASFDDAENGELGYPRDHEHALELLDSFASETGLEPHLVLKTPGGFQATYLTAPMRTPYDQELVNRFDSAFRGHLAQRGVCIDKGVITQVTRLSRAAGSFHVKEDKVTGKPTEPKLVTVHITREADAYSLDFLREALPATELRGRGLPVVNFDDASISIRFANALPISRLLEQELGWVQLSKKGTATSWNANVRESQSTDNAKTYIDEKFGFEKVRIYSSTVASVLDLPADHAFNSFDFLMAKYLNDDYVVAARLAERYLDRPLDLVERVKTADFDDLADEARKASGDWPQELDSNGAARLEFRGVCSKVAKARGYQTLDVASLDKVVWGSLANSIAERGTSRGLYAANVHPIEGGIMATLRAPSGQVEGEAVPARGYNSINYRRNVLDVNPINQAQVANKVTPLIVVTGLDVNTHTQNSHGQVHADAVITAALREGIEVGAVALRDWASGFIAAGGVGNASRADVLGRGWSRVPLTGRPVLLAGRVTWREEEGLIQLADLLAAKGANIRIIDVAYQAREQGVAISLETSTPSIGDLLAEAAYANNAVALQDLMSNALSLEEARWQSAEVENNSLAHGARIADSMAREKNYLRDVTSNVWAVDTDTHWKVGGKGSSPFVWARKQLCSKGLDPKSVRGMKDALAAAAEDERVQVESQEFDTDPYMFYMANGVVDLRTQRLRDRIKGELNAKYVPIAYDPEAKCPTWEKHLERITVGDKGLQAYLRRIFGLALIGELLEERVFIFFGTGRNGKTVTLNILMELMGVYSTPIPAELFTGDASPSQFAQLAGVRAAVGSETGEGDHMNVAQVKKLAERSLLTASRKFGQEFTFWSTHTVFLATNHQPRVLDTTEGAWRRLVLVPFLAQISESEADPMLETKLRAEIKGIMAWAVAGAAEVYERAQQISAAEKKDGGVIGTCFAVTQATGGYRQDNDLLGRFLATHCTLKKGRTVARPAFQGAFKGWMEDEEDLKYGWSAQKVKNALKERGVLAKRTSSGEVYTGIDLTPPALTEEEVEDEVASNPVPDSPAEIVDLPSAITAQEEANSEGEVEL